MLLVRLRQEGPDGADLAQVLYEGFQDDVELRVHAAGVKARPARRKRTPCQCLCRRAHTAWGARQL